MTKAQKSIFINIQLTKAVTYWSRFKGVEEKTPPLSKEMTCIYNETREGLKGGHLENKLPNFSIQFIKNTKKI